MKDTVRLYERSRKKTVAGILNPHITQRRNRAIHARFFCSRSHLAAPMGSGVQGRFGGPLLCDGVENPVRPAHLRFSTWQADVVENTQRFAMTKQKSQMFPPTKNRQSRQLTTPCAPEAMARGHINCALDRSVQMVDENGAIFLPLFGYLSQALAALDEFERASQRRQPEQIK